MSNYRWSDPPIGEPAPTGGGSGEAVEALGHFSASDTSGFDGSAYRVRFDTDDGSTPGFFSLSLAASPGWAVVTGPGVYSAQVFLRVTGADPGDQFRCGLENAGSYINATSDGGVADAGGVAEFSILCAPDLVTETTLTATLLQVGGTGTAPTLLDARMLVTKLTASPSL